MNKIEIKESNTNNQVTEFKREGKSMKRSLTRVLATTAALALMASVASANMSQPRFEVRPYTMGGESVNMILKSHSNIWMYPQTINQYPNQAEGVFDESSGNNSFPRFGAHYQFNEGNNPFVVGVYFENQFQYSPFGSGPGNPLYNNSGSVLPNRQLNLFYGRNLGGNPFGVHLYTFNSNDEQEGPNGYRAGLTSIGGTVGLTTGGGAWDWALSFGTTTFTDEDIDGAGNVTKFTEPDGSYHFGAEGRRWFPVNSKITWVAHAMFDYNRVAWTDPNTVAPNGPGTYKTKMTAINAGLGLNYTPTSKVHAILDVMINYDQTTDERDTNGDGTLDTDNTDKTASFPPSYTAGVDAEVLSWLDLRMGASNYRNVFTRENNITNTGKLKQNSQNVETFLGFGLHFGDLEIDTYVDPRFAVNGPYFVSGDNTSNMFMTAAATLHF